MSQYTDFSDNVFACLQQSTLLWHFPATVSPDTVVQFFVERLESLKKTIESLGKEGILEEFASHYPTLPSDLRQENCVSFHQLALKRAESRFRRVVNAADEIDRGGPKGILAPGLAKKLLANIADIPIDAQQIEENWDAVMQAAREGISADLTGVLAQLNDECVRTERVARVSPDTVDDAENQAPPTITEEPRFLFKRDGAYYRVRFDGEAATLPDQAGVRYLHELLQRRNVPIKATELRGDVEASPEIVEDKERLRVLHNQSQEVNADLERARDNNDMGEVDRLEEDRQAILYEVGRFTGPGGKARLNNPNDAARVAVTKAIKGIVKRCRTEWNMPRFADHLRKHLDTGGDCSYRPALPFPDWIF